MAIAGMRVREGDGGDPQLSAAADDPENLRTIEAHCIDAEASRPAAAAEIAPAIEHIQSHMTQPRDDRPCGEVIGGPMREQAGIEAVDQIELGRDAVDPRRARAG